MMMHKKREIKTHINKAISLAHNTDSQSILNARNALSKMFDGKYKQDFTVYAVGHGHLDNPSITGSVSHFIT